MSKPRFLTNDGYLLWLVDGAWYDAEEPDDAERSFDCDEDSWPIDADGKRLEGRLEGLLDNPLFREPERRFHVEAVSCDAEGAFDQAYSFANEGEMYGTAVEVGLEVMRLLTDLDKTDIDAMSEESGGYYLQLNVLHGSQPPPRYEPRDWTAPCHKPMRWALEVNGQVEAEGLPERIGAAVVDMLTRDPDCDGFICRPVSGR